MWVDIIEPYAEMSIVFTWEFIGWDFDLVKFRFLLGFNVIGSSHWNPLAILKDLNDIINLYLPTSYDLWCLQINEIFEIPPIILAACNFECGLLLCSLLNKGERQFRSLIIIKYLKFVCRSSNKSLVA